MSTDFTICVLLHGDYPKLADRCLRSIFQYVPAGSLRLRIGMNDVSEATLNLVEQLRQQHAPVDFFVWSATTNLHKYPMMRRLFYGENQVPPIETEFVMWFDDDSYIRDAAPGAWWATVSARCQPADMLGAVYTANLGGNQHEWIQDQPWYGGKDVQHGQIVRFATGGWWCIRREILERFNWPPPDFDHRGGDVMLGELCRQRGLQLQHFNTGIAINADWSGRESKAPRRGFDQKPIGWDYVRPVKPANVPVPPQFQKSFLLNLDL